MWKSIDPGIIWRYFFPHWFVTALLWKRNECVCVCVYFLKMIYIPLIYILILLYYLNNCSFLVSFKISKCKPFTHHLKKWFAIIGHFHFHINVKTSFSVYKYKLPNIFIYWEVGFPKRIPTLSCSIYNILHLYFITVTFVLLFC